MPIVMQCTALGCETLTMGPLCIEHELRLERMFVRGRPFARPAVEPRRAGDCLERVCAEPQKSVGATGGGSTPPLAATPASSRSPRRIAALRGAKSSRLLLNSA